MPISFDVYIVTLALKTRMSSTHFETPLFLGPVVDARSDHVPPGVDVGQVTPERRARRRQCQHDRGDGDESVVDPPRFVDVPRLERDL